MNKEENMEETDDKSFAELFEQSFKKPTRLEPGQKVEAVIVKITDQWIFLDLGDKSEGCLDRKKLLDPDGKLTAAEGDRVSAYFLSAENNERLFTTRVNGGLAAGNQYLEDAFHNRIPVEGVAEKEIKGGYEIKIAGSVRGFCPYSQMGLRRSDTPQDVIGKKLLFKITEYCDNGRSLVLSNRKVLEEERGRTREDLKKTLTKDMVVKGIVRSLRPFGAFVDIGGIAQLLAIQNTNSSTDSDVRHWQIGLTYGIPIGNRAAKANYAIATLNRGKSETDVLNAEQAVRVDVRITARNVESGVKRVEAARASTVLQRKTLEAEQKKFDNGMSTSFEVLRIQTDLSSAQLAEIRAMLDYMKSQADLERAQGTLLEARGLQLAE